MIQFKAFVGTIVSLVDGSKKLSISIDSSYKDQAGKLFNLFQNEVIVQIYTPEEVAGLMNIPETEELCKKMRQTIFWELNKAGVHEQRDKICKALVNKTELHTCDILELQTIWDFILEGEKEIPITNSAKLRKKCLDLIKEEK